MKKKKTYNQKVMDQAKSNVKLGLFSMPTTYAFSRVGTLHPTTAPTANAVVGGMNLLNVGNVAKSGMVLMDMFKDQDSKNKKKCKKKKY